MNTGDPIREFLQKRGCPEHVINGGMAGLIEGWEATVRAVKGGYPLDLDDYLNDLDGRQLLADALAVVPTGLKHAFVNRVRQADKLMKSLVAPLEKCLWGASVAKSKGWTPKKNWWYFSMPLNASPELLSEIEKNLAAD